MLLGIPRPQNQMPVVKLPVMLCALCRPPDYADLFPWIPSVGGDYGGGVGIIANT